MQGIADYCGVCGSHLLAGVCGRCTDYHSRRLASIGLPNELIDKRFDTFDRSLQPQALDAAVAFVKDWPHHRCLLFTGLPGTGKSHLIAAILRECYERNNVVSKYHSVAVMTTLWKHAEDWSKFGREIVEPLMQARLIALDEIGREARTDQWLAELDVLLASRYSDRLPTILATNLALDAFIRHIGASLWSRLDSWAEILTMAGKSPDNDYRRRLKDGG